MTVAELPATCNHGNESGFTDSDLDNFVSLVNGGPMEPHRFNVSTAADFLAEHPELSPAEAIVELLLLIRHAS